MVCHGLTKRHRPCQPPQDSGTLKPSAWRCLLSENYGESFEGPLIACLSLAIIGGLGLAVWLINTHTPKCRTSDYTYCGQMSDF
jgi:hypothetical protein